MLEGITVNYHSSIRIEKKNLVIYFDPFKISQIKHDATYVFITHSHYDHFSLEDIKKVMNSDTKFIVPSDVSEKLIDFGISMELITVCYPGNSYEENKICFDAVAAYNKNKPFHKKEYNWLGYNVKIGSFRYYVVGDSDATDEVINVKCDVIFVPVGGVYTMNDYEASSAINKMKPIVAIPIHYDEVGSKENAISFVNDLKQTEGIILR